MAEFEVAGPLLCRPEVLGGGSEGGGRFSEEDTVGLAGTRLDDEEEDADIELLNVLEAGVAVTEVLWTLLAGADILLDRFSDDELEDLAGSDIELDTFIWFASARAFLLSSLACKEEGRTG